MNPRPPLISAATLALAAVSLVAFGFALSPIPLARAEEPVFRAGAAKADISPKKLPAIRNGGFLQKVWNKVADPLYARAVVLDDGEDAMAICVVDSCMLPTDVCDAIKAEVSRRVEGLSADRILISATHTHSAPGTMALCLGTRKDEAYTAQMIPQAAGAIVDAHAALRPARAGSAQVDAPEFTNCRRWIRRSDKMAVDPFGEKSVRAMMHPGYQNPEFTGPSGPVDPELSLLSFVGADDDKPICVLANYSMHYFGGGGGFSADYFGDVARRLEEGGGGGVGIVAQGTSGDLHWMDYSRPKKKGYSREKYARSLADFALEAWKGIAHRSGIDLSMAEARLPLRRRTPSPERLAWADPINAERGDDVPGSKEEVYAEQARWIHENPETELVLQAARIGEVGLTAIPNEVYGITGLKLKARSPLATTFNIGLANGAEGYIPPPEQHWLGGYTTWPARTAGLEEGAEPKIVEALLALLEEVSGKARLPLDDSTAAPYPKAVLEDRPAAYWRLNDLSGPQPREATGRAGAAARFEDGVAFGLPGVRREGGDISAPLEEESPFTAEQVNRAAHFAGGRMRCGDPGPGRTYSAEFWFWNAFPDDVRPVTGYLFSRGVDGDKKARGEHLGIGGTSQDTGGGKLFFYTGNQVGQVVRGTTSLAFRDWHHVVIVREEDHLTVYLDGEPEIEADDVEWTLADGKDEEIFLGGRSDGMFGFEGKIDEVALYPAALTAEQVVAHFRAAERTAPGGSTPEPSAPKPTSAPLSPDEGLKALQLPEGFEAGIVAAEPQVLDPVAFDWDGAGRLWVVEMADYPLGLGEEGASGGRIRVLEDGDGDGVYETSTLFAEGLNFPNGLLTWRDGVLVTAAPDILYLEDSDGDGVADVREVLFTGLTEGNQQLRANGLRWGLDNWVYVAAGGHHGKYGADTKLHSSRTGEDTRIGSRDMRIRPDTGEVEPVSGPTQFGRNRDAWGHWFGTQNSRPLWHYVLPDRYLRRNPHLATSDGRVLIPGGVNPPVYPAKPPQKRYHGFKQAGHYTSACGGMIYRDGVLFPAGEIRAFTCEPFHNLVQQLRLVPDGVTFSGERVGGEGEPDFFASTDRWCRPVMARTGPDGALWVADMYRYMIEHPQFLPEEGKAELLPHYRIGDDRGRIYRIARSDAEGAGTKGTKKDSAPAIPKLEGLGPEQWISLLGSSNGWVRDKAQQFLLWHRDTLSEKNLSVLEKRARQAKLAETRLQALCTLDGLEALSPELVADALGDPHPGVRENALRLAEDFSEPVVLKAATALVEDPDPKVRLQLTFSLGEWEDEAAGRALADLVTGKHADSWLRTAALSSALPHLQALSASANRSTRSLLLPMALATGDHEALAVLLAPALASDGASDGEGDRARLSPRERWAVLGEFLDEVEARKETIDSLKKASADSPLASLLASLPETMKEAAARMRSKAAQLPESLASAALLSRHAPARDDAIAFLSERLQGASNGDDWKAVMTTLAATGADSLPETVSSQWPGLTPQQRGQALDALMTRPAWTESLVEALEEGEWLRPGDIDAARRMPLVKNPDKAIRKRAAAIFDRGASSSRTEVVERYLPALKRKGDPEKGRAVYRAACATCHQHGDEGVAIGPHLKSVVDHEPEKLLGNILDPNLDIQPGFHAYTAELKNGEQLFGLLASESGSSLTFKLPDGSERILRRKDVATLRSTGISLMPEGLEAVVGPEQMADLIAFLKESLFK